MIKKVNLAQTESFLIGNILVSMLTLGVIMKSGTANAESRDADVGNCVVVASLLFLISAAVHGVIHPEVGASAADPISGIAQWATVWQVAHLFFCV